MADPVIDPLAVVRPGAVLGENVQIGPFALIESGAVIGPGCVIAAQAVVRNTVTLGAGCRVGEQAVLGGDPQDLGFDPATPSRVEIGAGTIIREMVTIHRATRPGEATRVGARCYLMVGSHLGHDAVIGEQVILANAVLLAGHVEMGDRVVVGGGTVFHQFVRVGTGAMVQGLSKFGQDIPPGTLAAEYNGVAGLNVVGLRRAGYDAAGRAALREVFDLFYRQGLTPTQFVAQTCDRAWPEPAAAFVAFIAAGSKRGFCRFLKGAAVKERRRTD